MFYIKYITMYSGAIRKLLHGCAYVREIIHSLKLVDYLRVHTHKPYYNLHIFLKTKGLLSGVILPPIAVEDPEGVQGVRFYPLPAPVFKYHMKMKQVGLSDQIISFSMDI